VIKRHSGTARACNFEKLWIQIGACHAIPFLQYLEVSPSSTPDIEKASSPRESLLYDFVKLVGSGGVVFQMI
jgi:hypothetical protein